MRRWRGVEAVPRDVGRTVVTIGVFDGVHRGHQALVAETVRRADSGSLTSVLLTFDPHPLAVLRPDRAPRLLSTLAQRLDRLADSGLDAVLTVPFDVRFAETTAEDFVRDLLVDRLHARQVVVGHDFRFGRGAAGSVALLSECGRGLGFDTSFLPPVSQPGPATGHPISSTEVRALIAAGDLAGAAALLGRPHQVELSGVDLGAGSVLDCVWPAGLVQPPVGCYPVWLGRGSHRRRGLLSVEADRCSVTLDGPVENDRWTPSVVVTFEASPPDAGRKSPGPHRLRTRPGGAVLRRVP